MRVLVVVAFAVAWCCGDQVRALPIPEGDETVDALTTTKEEDTPAVMRIPPPGVKLALPQAKSIVTLQAEGNVIASSPVVVMDTVAESVMKNEEQLTSADMTVHELVPSLVMTDEKDMPATIITPDEDMPGPALKADEKMPSDMVEDKGQIPISTTETKQQMPEVMLKADEDIPDIMNTEEKIPDIMMETEEKMTAAEPMPEMPNPAKKVDEQISDIMLEPEAQMTASETLPGMPMEITEPMSSPTVESDSPSPITTPLLLAEEPVANEDMLTPKLAPVTAIEVMSPISSIPLVESATPVLTPIPVDIGSPVMPSAPVLAPVGAPVMAPMPSMIVVEAPDPMLAPEPPMPSVSIPYVGGQFHAQDEAGQYYFGNWGSPNTRVETKDYLGRITGSFSYVNPGGDVQVRKYAAGPESGFRVAASDLPVDTPEVTQIKDAQARLLAAISDITKGMEIIDV